MGSNVNNVKTKMKALAEKLTPSPETIQKLKNNFEVGTMNLKLGESSGFQLVPSDVIDKFDPDRGNFYYNFRNNPENVKIAQDVFKVAESVHHENVIREKNLNTIAEDLDIIKNSHISPCKDGESSEACEKRQKADSANAVFNKLTAIGETDLAKAYGDRQDPKIELPPKAVGGGELNGLKELNPMEKKRLVFVMDKDPVISTNNFKPKAMDSVIFIVVSYYIQLIAQFFVEWLMAVNVATDMNEAVLLFLVIYLIIYTLVVSVVHFSPMEASNALFLFSARIPGGSLRVIMLCIPYFFLFMIWSILKIRKMDSRVKIMTISERKSMMRQLNKIAFTMWGITGALSFAL